MEPYFLESNEGIIPSLYILLRGLYAISSADESTILFNSPDMSGTSAIFGSRTLHVSHVKDSVLKKLDHIVRELDRLTFHESTFVIGPNELVHDEPRKRTPGYSFIVDERNSWTRKPTVLEYILTTPNLLQRFAYQDSTGQVVWKPGPCYRYMNDIYQLQMELFLVAILTFGEPGRGAELAAHLLSNVPGGSIRNVFVLFKLFSLRGSYNKTSHATHGDKTMVRIPLPSIGHIWVRFLAFLRPIFITLQTHF